LDHGDGKDAAVLAVRLDAQRRVGTVEHLEHYAGLRAHRLVERSLRIQRRDPKRPALQLESWRDHATAQDQSAPEHGVPMQQRAVHAEQLRLRAAVALALDRHAELSLRQAVEGESAILARASPRGGESMAAARRDFDTGDRRAVLVTDRAFESRASDQRDLQGIRAARDDVQRALPRREARRASLQLVQALGHA
jgi:hypothetical protein